jgi:hypothetical protein
MNRTDFPDGRTANNRGMNRTIARNQTPAPATIVAVVTELNDEADFARKANRTRRGCAVEAEVQLWLSS